MITEQIALRLRDAGFCELHQIIQDPTVDHLLEKLADNFYILEKRGDRFYCLKPNIFNESETNFELSSGSSAKEALAMLYLYYHETNKRNNGME